MSAPLGMEVTIEGDGSGESLPPAQDEEPGTGGSCMTEHPHTIEGDIECSCHPLVLTVAADGSISRVAGGPLEEPIDTEVAPRAEGLLEGTGGSCMTEQERPRTEAPEDRMRRLIGQWAERPGPDDWTAHGLAALDELRRLYFEGSEGRGPGDITVKDWDACEDAIRAALEARVGE